MAPPDGASGPTRPHGHTATRVQRTHTLPCPPVPEAFEKNGTATTSQHGTCGNSRNTASVSSQNQPGNTLEKKPTNNIACN